MGEPLSFAEIKLTTLQGFLCALAICDVLNSAKHLTGPSRRIPFDSAEAMNSAHVTVGANDSMLSHRRYAAADGFIRFSKNSIAIVRVDHFADQRHVNGSILGRQSIDAIEFS